MNRRSLTWGIVSLAVLSAGPAWAQDRFEHLPGYEDYQQTTRNMRSFVTGGTVSKVGWAEDGSSVTWKVEESYFSFDFATRRTDEIEDDAAIDPPGRSGGRGPRGASRGRQVTKIDSPDKKWVAAYADFNVRLEAKDGSKVIPVTTTGTADLKYGTGSWVYGEELRQNSAMWWSPDSTRLAFYEFNDAEVLPFYLTPDLTKVQNKLYTEWYPKAGAPNPIVALLVYNLETQATTRIDVGDDTDQYIYNVRWSPDGDEVLFNQTNRHQNILNLMAAEPDSGSTRTIVTETQETWQANSPLMRYLADDERFIWETEKSSWKHYELRHLDGSLIAPLTSGDFPCSSITKLDEEAEWLYFTAYSSETPLNQQLHRVRLDGSGQHRLTIDDLNHSSISISPDHRYFIATGQSIDTPPVTCLYDMNGQRLATLAESDTSGLNGRPMPEMFTYKADDGVTDLYGVLYKPSDFDPNKTYPLLIEVYGGPWSQTVRSSFRAAHPYCELGFIIAKMDNRGTPNRGKVFEDAAYLKLGIVDIKDQVDGVKYLTQRDYIDGNRVGITGHSYGGYMSALGILKYPDVFHVSVAGAAVTDWRNYDTIYTERFMRTPEENSEGYEAGSCLTYADQLKGDLLLMHGMVDDNVHPSNVWQLVHELQGKKKPFDIMFYPNSGHGFRSPSATPLKWEFLYEHLIEDGG